MSRSREKDELEKICYILFHESMMLLKLYSQNLVKRDELPMKDYVLKLFFFVFFILHKDDPFHSF